MVASLREGVASEMEVVVSKSFIGKIHGLGEDSRMEILCSGDGEVAHGIGCVIALLVGIEAIPFRVREQLLEGRNTHHVPFCFLRQKKIKEIPGILVGDRASYPGFSTVVCCHDQEPVTEFRIEPAEIVESRVSG